MAPPRFDVFVVGAGQHHLSVGRKFLEGLRRLGSEDVGYHRDLAVGEAKHGHQFVDMVLKYFEADTVYARLAELVEREAKIIEGLAWRPALH